MSERSPRSVGVTIFGILLILSSLIHVQKLIDDVSIYVHYYSYLPPWMIVLRYSFSWIQRLIGILVGVGLLSRKDIARKVGMLLGLFTILTIYWKHPYDAFKIHTALLDQRLGNIFILLGVDNISFSSLTIASMIAHYIADSLFWGVFIFFFTRPSVKAQFKIKL